MHMNCKTWNRRIWQCCKTLKYLNIVLWCPCLPIFGRNIYTHTSFFGFAAYCKFPNFFCLWALNTNQSVLMALRQRGDVCEEWFSPSMTVSLVHLAWLNESTDLNVCCGAPAQYAKLLPAKLAGAWQDPFGHSKSIQHWIHCCYWYCTVPYP